ncbi:hypothetical protein DEO72_LG9g132 [Vigna unguiculata]|uniref:GIR1-like zinc ribbon domain-containing protein n=1 Tax=Vigna unguiculata TaxID=3917 RepID=A0A4D6MWX3_VIGUN|nr:hypothetical protein DEO72_LG9g132 [Vigna unguiculata]
MSDRNESVAELGLNLNLSPPRVVENRPQSPTPLPSVLPASPSNSCVSTELNQDDDKNNNNLGNPNNNPEAVSLIVVGCPNCLMYLMISEDKHQCPICKNTTLIHFPDGKNPVIRN